MPRTIIVLEKAFGPGGDQNIKVAFWFPVTASQEVPKPGFQSACQRISPAEGIALQSGTVMEEVFATQYPVGATIGQIQTDLIARYTARQTQIAATVPNPNQWYGTSYDGASWVGSAIGPPPKITTARTVLGAYRGASPLITGTVAAQNLLSIENPAASMLNIFVKRVGVQGLVGIIATVKFLYRLGRTTALPSAGTVLTAQKFASSNPAPVAIVRQAPTATAAAGDMWTSTPGIMVTAVGEFVPAPLIALAENRDDDDVMLVPGEGLLVRADANTIGWAHSVYVSWQEAS